jgi:hypothetical protein
LPSYRLALPFTIRPLNGLAAWKRVESSSSLFRG